MPSALELYQVLSKSDTNLRQPIELENQLLKHMTMDSEVGQFMLQLLQVTDQMLSSFVTCAETITLDAGTA